MLPRACCAVQIGVRSQIKGFPPTGSPKRPRHTGSETYRSSSSPPFSPTAAGVYHTGEIRLEERSEPLGEEFQVWDFSSAAWGGGFSQPTTPVTTPPTSMPSSPCLLPTSRPVTSPLGTHLLGAVPEQRSLPRVATEQPTTCHQGRAQTTRSPGKRLPSRARATSYELMGRGPGGSGQREVFNRGSTRPGGGGGSYVPDHPGSSGSFETIRKYYTFNTAIIGPGQAMAPVIIAMQR